VALFSSKKSKSLYLSELQAIRRSLTQSLNEEKASSDPDIQLALLYEIQDNLLRFGRLNTVSTLLGNPRISAPDISSVELQKKIQFHLSNLSSIDALSKMIVTEFNAITPESIKIFPVHSKSSTQLSRLLKEKINSLLNKSNGINAFLRINYEEIDNSLKFYVNAINSMNNTTIKSRSYSLQKVGYSNIDYKPSTLNFQQLLHEGYVIESSFKSYINTDLGDNGIEASIGDSMQVYVKLSQAGYFYIINYSSDGKAYLLELTDAVSNRRFIQYVNADDANKWISLGEFEISPPLGSESLHLIASKHDLVSHLPSVTLNQRLEIWESTKDPLPLIKELRSSDKQAISEDTLTFTSLP